MAESNRLPKPIEDRIDLVDSWILSPENRSKKVWAVISQYQDKADEKSKLTNWDIICFCAAYLKNNVPVFNWLLDPIKQLGRLIFNAHYFATESTGLLLDLKLDTPTDFLNGLQPKPKDIPESKGIPERTP